MNSFVGYISECLGFGYYVLVYAVGALAMLLSVCAFQMKRRIYIVVLSSLGQTSWVIYFLLQADLVSAFSCALTAVMLALFSRRDKWEWITGNFSVGVFIGLIAGFSVFTFAVWSDVFPLLAGTFAAVAGSREDERRIRQFSVLWCFFWLLNSTFKVYPIAFANDLFCTASAITSLIRYRKGKNA